MRIHIGVSMSREVLCTGNYTGILKTFHVGIGFRGHIVYVFSEGSVMDHRILRIVIYIGNGSKIDMRTYSSHLTCYILSHIIDHVVIGYGTECQLFGI